MYDDLLLEAKDLLEPSGLLMRDESGFQLAGKRRISFISHRPFTPALADTDVLDYFWRYSTPKYYVSQGDCAEGSIEVLAFIKRNIVVRMPLVSVYEDAKKLRVVFISGPQLFALMRDLGFKEVPVMFTRESRTLFDRYIRSLGNLTG